MTPVLLSFALLLLLAAVIGAWFLGKAAGVRAAEVARGGERLQAERERAEEAQTLLLARAELSELKRDRDRAAEALAGARMEAQGAGQQLAAVRESLAAAEAEGRARAEALRERDERLHTAEGKLASLYADLQSKSAELESARKQIEMEAAETEKKLKLLADAEEKLGDRFKVLAGEIFRERSETFRQDSEKNLGSLLNPLREHIGVFQQRVEALRDDGIKGREELKQQIGDLKSLNQQLSSEAGNLARALKGSSKAQGDWGEFVLEQMLENAGLRRDHQYRVQTSFANAENGQSRPDLILDLPGGRHLIIDAKVSLTDYSAYCDCQDDLDRSAALAAHVGSVRGHIRGLAARDYPSLHQLASVDFVVMFVPIEPAFLLAISREGNLWQEAWDKNVLLVSPSTLLFVIRTVAHLWRQEQQKRNVQEIVKRGGELYDKLAAFAKDLTVLGAKLGDAQKSYDDAFSKLARGRGNAIRQVEMLRELGVKPSKQMPKELLDAAGLEVDGEVESMPILAQNGVG